MTSTETTGSDVGSYLRKLASTSDGRQVLFEFIKEKPKRIFEIYKNGKKVGEILTLLSSYVHSELECAEVVKTQISVINLNKKKLNLAVKNLLF